MTRVNGTIQTFRTDLYSDGKILFSYYVDRPFVIHGITVYSVVFPILVFQTELRFLTIALPGLGLELHLYLF
jgi:hypothetical protein